MIFSEACDLIEQALAGTWRQEVVAYAADAANFAQALVGLRDQMRAKVWTAGRQHINLERIINPYDERTRRDGFHVLHDWDGKADKVNEDTIPVDVLHFVMRLRGSEPIDPRALAILVDYDFLHVLCLLSLRIWDDGGAGENLERLNVLLGQLQGPNGSGQSFAANAETLLLIATSHFELQERGYSKLLAKVRTLDAAHQIRIALGHASSMGSHLRFGFEATYGRDTLVMRNDNVADYPWLCFALATLMEDYARAQDTGAAGDAVDAIAEALLNGLSADARAFVGDPSPALSSCEAERSAFRDLFLAHRDALLDRFERWRPSARAYSPLSFYFNFSHNVLKGTVIDALLRGQPWALTLNDLLTALPDSGDLSDAKTALAVKLMEYARSSPDRIRGRATPVIVYDPESGREAFSITMRKLREGS